MSPRPTFVVLGAGLTGGAAVTTLRGEGFDGRLVMVGSEPHPPYERPPLSKEYLRDERRFEQSLLHPPGWYEEHDVELLLGSPAAGVDVRGRTVELAGGGSLPFDRLLLATGGRNRRPPIAGLDLDGAFQLRTVEEADRLRAAARPGARAVVVGAGFIGSEVAASLRARGVEVVLMDPGPVPLRRVLGTEVGAVLAAIHRDHGVALRPGERLERLEGTGRVEVVVTRAGERIECDFAVVGIGIEPAVELAVAAGLDVNDGVLVDAACRTSAPGVLAAGDVARHDHPLFGSIRVEHYDNALKMGTHAARVMLGSEEPFEDPHWFWSDQYEHNLQYVGYATEWDELIVRGSLERRSFVAFYVKEGLIRAAVGIDRGKDVRRAARLISAGTRADADALRDEGTDLRSLAGAGALGG